MEEYGIDAFKIIAAYAPAARPVQPTVNTAMCVRISYTIYSPIWLSS